MKHNFVLFLVNLLITVLFALITTIIVSSVAARIFAHLIGNPKLPLDQYNEGTFGAAVISVYGGLAIGFLSAPLAYFPGMKIAKYLREKRGWTEIRHPRKIFALALLTFYSPIILAILVIMLFG